MGDWLVRFAERKRDTTVTFEVCGGSEHEAIAAARAEMRHRTYCDFGDPIVDDPEFVVELALEQEDVRGATGDPGAEPLAEWELEAPIDCDPPPDVAAEPPAEWELEAEATAEPAAPDDAEVPADPLTWNSRLAAEGLCALTDSQRERDGAIALHLLLFDEPTRWNPRVTQPASPLLVTAPDGSRRYEAIGRDEKAITEWLERSAPIGEHRGTLRRGRPSADRAARHAELARLVHELVQMGASKSAIARVLDCGRDVVSRLEKKYDTLAA